MVVIGLLLIALTVYYVTLSSPNIMPGTSTVTTTVTRNVLVPYTYTVTIASLAPTGKTTTLYETRTVYIRLNQTKTITLTTYIPVEKTLTLTKTITITKTITQQIYTTPSATSSPTHTTMPQNITTTTTPVYGNKTQVITGEKTLYINLTEATYYSMTLENVNVDNTEYDILVSVTLNPKDNETYMVTINLSFTPPLTYIAHQLGFTGLHHVDEATYVSGGYSIRIEYRPLVENNIEAVTLIPTGVGDNVTLLLILPKHRPSIVAVRQYWYLVLGSSNTNEYLYPATYVVDEKDGSIVFAYTYEPSIPNTLIIVKVYPNASFAKAKIVTFPDSEIYTIGLEGLGDGNYLLYAYGSFKLNDMVVNGLVLCVLDRNLNLVDAKILKIYGELRVRVIGNYVYILLSGLEGFTLLLLNGDLEVEKALTYKLGEGRHPVYCNFDVFNEIMVSCVIPANNTLELYVINASLDGEIRQASKWVLTVGNDVKMASVTSIDVGSWGSCATIMVPSLLANNTGYLVLDVDGKTSILETSPAPLAYSLGSKKNLVYLVLFAGSTVIALMDSRENTVEKTLTLPSNALYTSTLEVKGNSLYYLTLTDNYTPTSDIILFKLPLNLEVKLGYQPIISVKLSESKSLLEKPEVQVVERPWPYEPLLLTPTTLIVRDYHKPELYFVKYLSTSTS